MAERRVSLDVMVRTLGEGSLDKLKGKLEGVEKAGKKSGSGLKEFAGKGGAVLAGAAALTFGLSDLAGAFMDIGKEAATLDAQMTTAKATFEGTYSSIEKWAKKTAGASGQTSREAIALATSTMAAMRQMGLSTPKALRATKAFQNMAAALSYASGGTYDVAETTEWLQSAMRGEYDSLQRLIPNISNARVQNVALQIAHKRGKKAIDNQSTALAVLGIAQRDGARYMKTYKAAQGSSLTAINKAEASMREQWQTIELKLLPGFVQLTEQLSAKATPALEDFISWLASPDGKKALDDWTFSLAVLGGTMGKFAQDAVWLTKQLSEVVKWGANAYNAVIRLQGSDTGNGGGSYVKSASDNLMPDKSKLSKIGGGSTSVTKGGGKKDNSGIDWSGNAKVGKKSGSKATYDDPDLERVKSKTEKYLDRIESRYEKHKAKLDALKSKYAELRTSIIDAFKGAEVTGRGSTYSDMMASYRESRTQGSKMLSVLKRLKKLGLSNKLLGQLAEGGPAALAQAESILAAGKSGISALNAQDKALSKIAKQAGTFVADKTYGAQIKAQTRETKLLGREIRSLNRSIRMLERKIDKGANISDAQANRMFKLIIKRARAAGSK